MADATDETKKRGITRTALLLLPVQIVFRTGEAILPLLLAAWFGRSAETDLYFLALAFFTFVGSLLVAAFQDSAFVPVLTEVRLRDRDAVPEVAGSILAHAVLLALFIAVTMGGLAVLWTRLRYDDTLFVVGAGLGVAFSAHLVVTSVRAFFVGLLNTHQLYVAHPIGSGIGITVALGLIAVLRHSWGVRAVPIGLAVGECVSIAILAFIAIRVAKIRIRPNLRRPEPARRFARLVAMEVMGSAITRINPVVDQIVADFSPIVGAGTVLRFSFDVASLPTSLVQATVLPVLLSQLSNFAAQGHVREYRRTLVRALWVVCALLVGLSVLTTLVRVPLVDLLFLHGAMDSEGASRIARVVPYALVGVAPFGALLILARAHVALQNTRIMVSMGLLNAVLNAVFNVAFFSVIGLEGIALSTSFMNLAIALVFWVRLRAPLRRLAGANDPV